MAQQVIQSESETISLTDAGLRKESLALRYALACGQPAADLLVRGFALVRESARRHLGIRHYPVQIMGGIAMHFGCVVEMQTGEGKTLAATLPLYLAALTGRGAHLATANDYLATRDAAQMQPVFAALGLSTGVVTAATPPRLRPPAYAADITYATGKEIGFDFLRDRLADRLLATAGTGQPWLVPDRPAAPGPIQRALHFMLVDEADSILIDEARTPLIISSLPAECSRRRALYQWAASITDRFREPRHFTVHHRPARVTLSGDGRKLVRKLEPPGELAGTTLVEIYHQLELALHVERNFVRDRHYVIRDNAVLIVDEFTGRIAEGRKWRTGLHQAIEAREGLQITEETAEAARISVQDLFGQYRQLCGMTGTVAASGRELYSIYRTPVVAIPTHRPRQRTSLGERVLPTEQEKWKAIAEEAIAVSQSGRPVLIGTRSIDKSEQLSRLLETAGVAHQVLNARNPAHEAEIVAGSGAAGQITVATNMAGRGTDIGLDQAARSAGGLHVIVSELHDSRRIDDQLTGRCGRQGDPGSFRYYMSLEDEILQSGFGNRRARRLASMGQQTSAHPPRSARVFRQAQKRIESGHYRARRLMMYQEKMRQEAQRELGQDPYTDTIG